MAGLPGKQSRRYQQSNSEKFRRKNVNAPGATIGNPGRICRRIVSSGGIARGDSAWPGMRELSAIRVKNG